ncbi:MAG: hypothetical protein QUV05_23290 [Phycisphaerae bacterium]|nr:hypothetical protein [Phycisphaerae bacterium]
MLRAFEQIIFTARRGTALFLLGSTLTMSGVAHADLVAYDPFAYGSDPAQGQYALGDEDAGTNVMGGQNPSIGPTAFYSGPWIQSGGDAQVVKALPSLSYPGFPAGQGGIQQETMQFQCCTFGRSGRPIAGGLGSGNARTIYESFLIDFGTQGTDDPAQFGLRGHELWNGGIGDAFAAVALFVNHFSGVGALSLRVATASSDTTVPVSGGGLDLNALAGVHLVVMKYAFHPTDPDVVSVYLDPVVAAGEPVVPQAQISLPLSDLFITHQGAFSQFTFSGSGHVPGAIDEIRWGDTFADVVPEPATALMLAVCMSAFPRRRR